MFIYTKTGFVINFPKYLHSFCGQTACTLYTGAVFKKKPSLPLLF